MNLSKFSNKPITDAKVLMKEIRRKVATAGPTKHAITKAFRRFKNGANTQTVNLTEFKVSCCFTRGQKISFQNFLFFLHVFMSMLSISVPVHLYVRGYVASSSAQACHCKCCWPRLWLQDSLRSLVINADDVAIESLFYDIDHNSSGVIDFKEFVAAISDEKMRVRTARRGRLYKAGLKGKNVVT